MSSLPIFSIRLEPDELKRWKRAAKRSGKTVSDWLRDLAKIALQPPTPEGPR